MPSKKPSTPSGEAQKSNAGGNWSLEMKAKVLEQEKLIEELRKKNEELEQSKSIPQLENTPQLIQNVPSDVATKMAELQGMINVLMHKQNNVVSTTEERWKTSPVPADIQETKVTFSARSAGYVISSYIKNSVLYVAPFKSIYFKYSGSDIRKNGKEQDIVCYCTYTTNIIKEIEFLRNHPLYGIGFSENLNETVSADAKFLYRLTAIISRLKSMSSDQMINNAAREKINIHGGMSNEQILMELATIMVKKEVQMETERQESSFLRQIQAMQNTQ